MKDFMAYNRDILKNIFIVYSNFFHWTLSKVVIVVYATLCSLLFSLLPGYFGYVSVYNIYADAGVRSWVQTLNETNSGMVDASIEAQKAALMPLYGSLGNVIEPHFVDIIILISCLLFIAAVIAFFFSYNSLLMTNLIKGYLHNEKIPFLKNHYFHLHYLKKFLCIFSWIGFYGLCIVIGFILALL